MKGGLYVAILFSTLLYDASVSGDTPDDKTGSHNDATDEISDGVEELSDSAVSDEFNSFVFDKENAQGHMLHADTFLTDDRIEVNKISSEVVGKELHKKLFGGYVTAGNDYYDETLFSAEYLNNEYSDDKSTDEAKIANKQKKYQEISNKEETKRVDRYSREAEAEEIFSSEEENGWNEETNWLKKEDNNQAGEVKQNQAIDKETRRVNKGEPKAGSKKQDPIGNELHASDHRVEQIRNPLNSTRFITVNHYFCMSDDVTEKHLILYGTKAWEFPLQDVNLTLTYPTSKPDSPMSSDSMEEVEYIITGFKVVLYIEGAQTRGYIADGGIHQDKLSLTFINSAATSLFYKFWLYGTPKTNAQLIELHNLQIMCS